MYIFIVQLPSFIKGFACLYGHSEDMQLLVVTRPNVPMLFCTSQQCVRQKSDGERRGSRMGCREHAYERAHGHEKVSSQRHSSVMQMLQALD